MDSSESVDPDQPEAADASGSYDTYVEYNKVLRTWFVAFGIGGPAIFLVNDAVAKRLVASGELRLLVFLFLFGVGAQVLGALVNKIANWYVYQVWNDDNVRGSRRHRMSEWLVEQFWIDILIDVATIIAFGWAASTLLTVFSPAAP